MTATPYLYDQVKLKDATQGVVRYIGEVRGQNGTFFGLEMLPYYNGYDKATTTGTDGDQQYFKTKNNAKTGRFVTEDDIDDIIANPTHDFQLDDESPPFTVGDRVYVDKKQCNGMIHYVGIPKFAQIPKAFIGIELEEPNGNCNGTLVGCTYFTCEDKYGLYSVPKNISLAQEEVNVDIDEVDDQNYDSPVYEDEDDDNDDNDDEKDEEYVTPQDDSDYKKIQKEEEERKRKQREREAEIAQQKQKEQEQAKEKEKEKQRQREQEEKERLRKKQEADKAAAEREQREQDAKRRREQELAAQQQQKEQEQKEKQKQKQAQEQERIRQQQQQREREEAEKRRQQQQLEQQKQREREEQQRKQAAAAADQERKRQDALKKQREEEEKRKRQQQQQQQAKNYGGGSGGSGGSGYNDDYKVGEDAPKLGRRSETDADGVITEYPTYMTNFNVKCRTHHKLKNYKTINYSSKKFQVDDMNVQQRLEDLAKNAVSDRGHFVMDGNKRFAYVIKSEPHEWRAALRINTDEIGDAQKLLNYVEVNTQDAVKNVDKIQRFNWDKHFQSLVSAIRKANM